MTPSDDPLDRLVRDHLRREAARTDTGPLLGRLHAEIAPAPRRFPLKWLAASAVAAGLLIAFAAGWQARPMAAGPRTLLREAQEAHRMPLDRCYLVEVQREADSDEANPMAANTRTTRLWTRGDRFWIESTSPLARWAWGRDEAGNVWLAPGPHRAIRIAPNETPRWLALFCDFCTMQPEKLLDEMLRDFDLTREADPTADGPAVHRVRAEAKAWQLRPLRHAELELDAESKVIRRAVLLRQWNGVTATTTYTLVETRDQDDARYQLEGHLTAPYEVYTAENQPQRRREVLTFLFGPRAADWLKPGTP